MRALKWLLPLLCCSLAAVAEEQRMAVLELRSKLEAADKKLVDPGYFSDLVRSTALEVAPSLQVMTRENVLVLLKGSGKTLEDCQGECEVDTGRLLGADLIVSGELLKIGTSYKLTLKMHETKDGQLLAGAQASGKSVDELDAATATAVRKLFAQRTARAAPAQAAPAPAPVQQVQASPPARIAQGAPAAAGPADLAALAQGAIGSTSCGDSTGCLQQKKCRDERKCDMLAFGYTQGVWGLPKQERTGVALYALGCDQGDPGSCAMAGHGFGNGTGVAKDRSLARDFVMRGCRLDVPNAGLACGAVALYGSSEDTAEAKQRLNGFCDKGDAIACAYAGRNK